MRSSSSFPSPLFTTTNSSDRRWSSFPFLPKGARRGGKSQWYFADDATRSLTFFPNFVAVIRLRVQNKRKKKKRSTSWTTAFRHIMPSLFQSIPKLHVSRWFGAMQSKHFTTLLPLACTAKTDQTHKKKEGEAVNQPPLKNISYSSRPRGGASLFLRSPTLPKATPPPFLFFYEFLCCAVCAPHIN